MRRFSFLTAPRFCFFFTNSAIPENFDVKNPFKTYFSIAFCTVLILMLSSCLKQNLPPFFATDKNGQIINNMMDLSLEARYSMLEWYKTAPFISENYKIKNSLLDSEQQQVLQKLRLQNSGKLSQQFPNLITMDTTGSFRFSPTYFTDNTLSKDSQNILKKLRNQLLRANEIIIPIKECRQKLQTLDSKNAEAFAVWAKKHNNSLKNDALILQEKLHELDKIQDALILQKRTQDTLSEAEALRKSGNGVKALDLLQEFQKENIGDQSLSLIGDTTTLAKFEDTIQNLPGQFIQQILTQKEHLLSAELTRLPLDATPDESREIFLNSTEFSFSGMLKIWLEDNRFQSVLKNTAERRSNLIQQFATLRMKLWQHTLKQNADLNHFWDTYLQFQKINDEIKIQEQKNYLIYARTFPQKDTPQSILSNVKENLFSEYLKILPQAANYYLTIGEKHSNITNKHGIALLITKMLQKMFEPVTEKTITTHSISEFTTRILALQQKSLLFLQKENLSHKLILHDLSSPTPGLGMSYTRDLDHIMQKIIVAADLPVQIMVINDFSQARDQDYIIFGGVIASYDGSETIERQNIRTALKYDEITKSDNPFYLENAKKDSAANQKFPTIYEQKVFEQIIRMNEIERLAHLRIFFNVKGPGVNNVIEINEFYSKKFLVEQSHPINDCHLKKVLHGYNKTGMQLTPSAPVSLENDRVWSTGELLDLARKDSLKMLAMKILYHLSTYPLFLAQEASETIHADKLEAGTELWGVCAAACNNLNTPQKITTIITPEFTPPAKCYAENIKDFTILQENLNNLNCTLYPRAFAALNQYLKTQ